MTPAAISFGPRRGKAKIVIMIALAALLGAGASFVVLARMKHQPAAQAAAESEAKAEPKPEAPPDFVELGAFVVNLASEGELRYLKVSITLVAHPKKSPDAEAKGKEEKAKSGGESGKKPAGPQLSPADDGRARDTVITVLSDQRFDGLRKSGPREAAKRALARELNKVLTEYNVTSVLFTSFVMQ